MTEIKLEIYADEQYFVKTAKHIAMGALFVPDYQKEKLINNLMNMRCLSERSKRWFTKYDECPFRTSCKPEWHELNDAEIHFQEARSSRVSDAKKRISEHWLKWLIENNLSQKNSIYFGILYLDLHTLKRDRFGQEKTDQAVYNRFFRTLLSWGPNYFFKDYDKVIIEKVYHDEGSMDKHKYFPYLNLQKLDALTSDRVEIMDYSLNSIVSDHKKNEEEEGQKNAHLIQFIDLIMGASSQNIFNNSQDSVKKELAMIIRPLVQRLLNSPYNYNSSYNYFKKQQISFFPRYLIEESKDRLSTLNGKQIEIYKSDNFYHKRRMEMLVYDPSQTRLGDAAA